MNYDTLMNLVKDAMPTLSPQLQRAVMVLETRPDDVALLSMRELSASAGINPSTFTRLARSLGFEDYAALRQIVVNRIRARGHDSFSDQAKKYVAGEKGRGRNSMSARLRELHQSVVTNLDKTFSPSGMSNIEAAAEILAQSRRVYLAGARSCVALTGFFQYASRLFSDKVVCNPGPCDASSDHFRYLKKGDVVLVMMFDPYTRVTGEALEQAAELGAVIILITDSALAPNAGLATLHLVAPVETASFFHSLAAPLAMLDGLLLAWLKKEGRKALLQLELTDQKLQEGGVYLRPLRLRAPM